MCLLVQIVNLDYTKLYINKKLIAFLINYKKLPSSKISCSWFEKHNSVVLKVLR